MTNQEVTRWDARYAEGTYTARPDPSTFLVDWLPRIPVGTALDVASGTGRNALHLAQAGFEVTAVDGSTVAIDQGRAAAEVAGLALQWVAADLDEYQLDDRAFDLITVVRYRNPRLWPRLLAALRPGGWLVVEHHCKTHLAVGGPKDPDFRLDPGELLEAFGSLRVVHYSEMVEASDHPDIPTQQFVSARLVAVNGDPGW